MFKIVVLSLLVAFTKGEDCNVRQYENGNVCVCNSTYCDTVPDLDVSSGHYQLYSSSEANIGFHSTTGTFSSDSPDITTIIVDKNSKYQAITGFGGAFTDAAGINIASLPEEAQEKLIESYFGESGISYSLCRVPIGGTDFSLRGYSYADTENDTALEHFALQDEDLQYKIPYILKAKELRNGNLLLFGSPWSGPRWMKTNNAWSGLGSLKTEYYQVWAEYIVKFLEEYEKHNISYWGITTQNEPTDGYTMLSSINSMGWEPEEMNVWVGENLGPTIRNSAFKDIKIMLHDDQRSTLDTLKDINLSNNLTMAYVDGVAVHWYADDQVPASSLDLLKTDKEDWFFISSEACHMLGFGPGPGPGENIRSIEKGSWTKGEKYITDILDNLEYGALGWVDWNMVLNETGGPTYIDNLVDSPIIVNETLQEFYKQPMYYGLGHFSKFAVTGSVRLATSLSEDLPNIRAMAFSRPDNLIALVIYNSATEGTTVQIKDSKSQSAVITIEGRSINTVLYQ